MINVKNVECVLARILSEKHNVDVRVTLKEKVCKEKEKSED